MKKRLALIMSAFLIVGLTFGMSFMHKASATAPGVNQLIDTNSSGTYANGGVYIAGYGIDGPRLSGDGRYVAFDSNATNLVSGDTNGHSDVFVKDTQTGTTTLVSLDSTGAQFSYNSEIRDISYDGRFVLFYEAGGLLFLRDTVNNTSTRVCSSSNGCVTYGSRGGTVSADGRYVTWANQDYPGHPYQAVLVDLQNNIFKTLSVDSSGNPGNGDSQPGAISCDGGVIGFYSTAGNLPSGLSGTYVATLDPSGTVHLSHITGTTFYNTNMSCDGNYMLSWGGGSAYSTVQKINRLSGQVSNIVPNGGITSTTYGVSISNDGRYVAVATTYNLDSSYPSTGAYNGGDAYSIDTKNSTAQLLSFTVAGNKSGSADTSIGISADGSKVAYGYVTPSSTDTTHELISGLTTGTASSQLDVYTSKTGY